MTKSIVKINLDIKDPIVEKIITDLKISRRDC